VNAGVAVVTGAARGIGAATARRLAAEGWALVLVDRCADDPNLSYPLARPEELEQVAAETGGAAVVADVRDACGLGRAVEVALDRHGRLDAAVAVAGCVAGGTPGWETPESVWETMIGVNLEGVWQLARAAVPALLRPPPPRRGRFVAVSSVAGVRGLPLLCAYAAAKHGVIGLVRSLAAELGPYGVTANVVAPGSTDTPMLPASAEVYGLSDVTSFAAQHRLGRLIEPAEVAALLAWVCSPASGAVTGAVLPVDAGMTAG
jgi:SDR family mycofactocin-dependent oxidoreductase